MRYVAELESYQDSVYTISLPFLLGFDDMTCHVVMRLDGYSIQYSYNRIIGKRAGNRDSVIVLEIGERRFRSLGFVRGELTFEEV